MILIMWHKFPYLKKHHQLIFSLIVVSGVTALWRGIWGLLDIYLLPGSPSVSFTLSIILGVVVIVATHYTIDKIV